MPEAVLSVHDLSVIYDNDRALEHITFDIPAGHRTAVIGPNGAGKSTLMKAIMGLLQPQSGTITINGGRDRLGYVPQYDAVNWSFPVTVRDVVMMGLVRGMGWFRWPRKHHWRLVDAALERVQLVPFASRQIGELSGGQRRRVFIARAIVQNADILLLDEPFAGVDVGAQSDLMGVLDTLHADGLTILLSTHDLGLAFSRFDTVVAVRQTLIACGKPADVYNPDVLSRLYGGRLATWDDGKQVMVFVDDHQCQDC